MHVNCIFHHLHREEPNLTIEKCQILKLVRQSFQLLIFNDLFKILLSSYSTALHTDRDRDIAQKVKTEVTLHKDRGDIALRQR